METFKRYLDQIRAEEDLKENTKRFLQKALEERAVNISHKERMYNRMKNETMKDEKSTFWNRPLQRALAVASIVVVAAAVAIAGYVYYQTPVNYVCLDINPSVELALNAFNRVVGIQSFNEDGTTLINKENVRNMSVENAIKTLVQNACEEGFVNPDGSSVVAVTAESNNENTAVRLQERSESGATKGLLAQNAFAAVYSNCSDLALRNEAKEQGISPGKYKLIQMLQTLDPTVTIEQYRNAKVYEIMNKAGEMIKADNSLGEGNAEMQAIVNRFRTAIEESEQSRTQAREQIRNGSSQYSQSGQTSQNQEQEQNQNGSAQTSQNQEQEQNQNRSAQSSGSGQSGSASQTSGSGLSGQTSGGSSSQAGNTSQNTSGGTSKK